MVLNMKVMVLEKELRKGFERRYRNILTKSKRLGIDVPDKEALWSKVLKVYRNGFHCEYCGRKMKIKGDGPYDKNTWSLDHKKSLWLGGDNSIDNFAIICHACNIIKGTMIYPTFRRLITLIKKYDPSLLDEMYDEVMAGRLADKIGREQKLEKFGIK